MDPKVLNKREYSILSKELSRLPDLNVEDIHLNKKYFDILNLIYEYNKNNVALSYKELSKELSVHIKTISRKLKDLRKKGLIVVERQGNKKTPFLTEKGKIMLNNYNEKF